MSVEFSKKYVATGKNREDRAKESKGIFDSLSLDVKQPDTAILLLQCKEKPILLSAVAALSKFGEKATENLQTLFDLEIVKNVMPLVEHKDLFTRRFAMKLLSQMAAISNVKDYLLKSNFYVTKFFKLLTEDSDMFMQEFSSRILAELTTNLYGVERLIQDAEDLDPIFCVMKLSDPDIKRNCIEIVCNLLKYPFEIDFIINCENFSFSSIYELFNEPYKIIQDLALEVLKQFLERPLKVDIQEMFRNSNGLTYLCDLLDNEEWVDLHPQVLSTLSAASENAETASAIINSEYFQKLFKYFQSTDNTKLQMGVLNVFVNLSKTHFGRKRLHDCEVEDLLLSKLQDHRKNNYNIICIGITRMSLFYEAAKDLSDKNVMKDLIELLQYEDFADIPYHESAFLAIKHLLNHTDIISETDKNLLFDLQEIIIKTFQGFSINVQIVCVHILEQLIIYNKSDQRTSWIKILCLPLELENPESDELKILCCDLLSKICLYLLQKSDSESSLFQSFKSQTNCLYNMIKNTDSLPVKNAGVRLLLQMCENSAIADDFVKNGCLIYMLQNRSPSRIIPTWDTCIATLLDAHLPSKFAYYGRLSFHDVTKNGFYAMRKMTCPFPDLEEFFRLKMCPIEAIYVVNFSGENINGYDDAEDVEEARNELKRESLTKGLMLSLEELESFLELRYGQMEADPDLCEYLNTVKCLITYSESATYEENPPGLVNVSKISSRARILAEFVIRQMSGAEQTNKCLDYRSNVHLEEIKRDIKRNVIPLGKLRIGSCFERALLFKVLADQILLPASLVRDQYGKAWIEISIPQIGNNDTMESSDFDENCYLPTKLLISNYIVDLMNHPGDLLPINSRRARVYLEHH